MNTLLAVPLAVPVAAKPATPVATAQAKAADTDASDGPASFATMLDDNDAATAAANTANTSPSAAADNDAAADVDKDKAEQDLAADTASNDLLAQLNVAAAILPAALPTAVTASTAALDATATTSKPETSATPATPAIPASVSKAATPATPATPAIPASASASKGGATPATPATPAIPASASKTTATPASPAAEASTVALAAESTLALAAVAASPLTPKSSKVSAIASAVSNAATVAPTLPGAMPAALALAMKLSAEKDSAASTDNKAAPDTMAITAAIDTAATLAQGPVTPALSVDASVVTMVSTNASPFPAGPLSAPVRADSLLPAPDKTLAMQAQAESAFAEAIGNRVVWQAGERIGRAEISLSPAGMGPVTVALHMDGTKVRADFSSAQPEVRAALESNMPRLREMLAGQGLQLAHAGVGSGNDNASRNPEFAREARLHSAGSGIHEEALVAAVTDEPRQHLRRGILDEYA